MSCLGRALQTKNHERVKKLSSWRIHRCLCKSILSSEDKGYIESKVDSLPIPARFLAVTTSPFFGP